MSYEDRIFFLKNAREKIQDLISEFEESIPIFESALIHENRKAAQHAARTVLGLRLTLEHIDSAIKDIESLLVPA